MRQIIVGFTGEGSTDRKFLQGVIKRTFERIAFDCHQQMEILDLQWIGKSSGKSFVDAHIDVLNDAYDLGISFFCIHQDADDIDTELVMRAKFTPLLTQYRALNQHQNQIEAIIPVIPIQMTESWMLADIEMLKAELGTVLETSALGLSKKPELNNDPKDSIEKAIHEVKKQRNSDLTINDLYQILGNKISIEKLLLIPSYNQFFMNVRVAFIKLGFVLS
jgi:Domain of unknown function (DUF4276)